MNSDSLHIPEGIRFDCSGCGNCCLQWPVPLTADDLKRIQSLPAVRILTADAPQIRSLPAGNESLSGFTHTLEKRADGKCTFLSETNRCRLHEEHGAAAKPAMCQLFPYSFTATPSGIYAYLSFASSGALLNQGTLLSEQQDRMQQQLELFTTLFPQVDSNWSTAQIIDGISLSWELYLEIEARMLAIIESQLNLPDALMECSRLVLSYLPADTQVERLPPVEASAKTVDQLILQQLSELYWPADVFAENSFDINARALMSSFVQPPAVVAICAGLRSKDFLDMPLDPLPDDIEELIRRFVVSRIFAKLYFCRSYAHLSLLAGINHLFMLVALIRLQAKVKKRASGSLDFWDVAEIIRTMERRLTQMNFSKEGCTVLEIILSSPSRLGRIRQLLS